MGLAKSWFGAVSSFQPFFAVIAKQNGENNPFFAVVQEGCVAEAEKLGVNCTFVAPSDPNAEAQVALVREFIAQKVDGIAISAINATLAAEVIDEAYVANIPVVTFDSDAPDSRRVTYVGTDNYALGQTLGKILYRLQPNGGYYAVVSDPAPNIQLRYQGVVDYLADTAWEEVSNSPSDVEDTISLAVDQSAAFVSQAGLKALVAVGGWPMYDSAGWQNVVDSNRNVTYVVGDALPVQLDLLASGYVNGLAGQVPYEMGEKVISLLDQLALSNNNLAVREAISGTVYGTAILEMVRVPLMLPSLNVNNNYIGNLRYVGFALFGIVAITAIGFAIWTCTKRRLREVSASQPFFLVMICIGALITASSIIPMSIDDSNPNRTQQLCNAMCMTVPWLAFIGFTITFSALFAKARRINKLSRNESAFRRMKVTDRDVILPFVFFLTANVVTLICWTLLAPRQYMRLPLPGRDGWNRIIATYGACQAPVAYPYLIALGVINISAVLIATWQAFEARGIQSEFGENRYIIIAMAVVLQAIVGGLPVLILVRKSPQVYYLVLSTMLFAISMSILLLMFIPKISCARGFRDQTDGERKQYLRQSMFNSDSPSTYSVESIDGSVHQSDGSCRHEDSLHASEFSSVASDAGEVLESAPPRISRRSAEMTPPYGCLFAIDAGGVPTPC